ncbi:MAG: cytochrome P450 [Micromonosporaceae bacterium]
MTQTAVRDLAAIPGPPSNGFVGSALLFQKNLLGTLTDGQRDYGDTVRYEVLPGIKRLHQTLVVAHHPDDIRTVLTQTERGLSKDTLGFRVLAEMLGLGLLTTEGATWKRQRRTVQPLFTPRTINRYAELMAAEATRLELAEGDTDLDLAMRRYTLRVVGRALFSEDIDDTVPALHQLVPRLSDITMRRTFQLFRLPLGVPTPRNRAARKVLREQDAIVTRILTGAGQHAGRGGERDDLLTRLRGARDPETGEPLSDQEIRDQILVFLLAGHETTAVALTAALHLLGHHRAEQDAVAEEVAEVLGGRTAPLPEDLPRLVRTRAVLLEAMRLYPPAYLTERVTTTEITIGGYAVPPGVIVMVAPWSTHRHPELWPRPECFEPSRFVGDHDRPHYAYFPFGGGPRSCVGEHFAMLEAIVLLAALLAKYQVTATRPTLPMVPLITLRPSGPVPARLTLRR